MNIKKNCSIILKVAGSVLSSCVSGGYYAFTGGESKSNQVIDLLHIHNDNIQRKSSTGVGIVFSLLNVVTNIALGKGAADHFIEENKRIKEGNLKEKILFGSKIMVGGVANLPTAYLIYKTIEELDAIPVDYKYPIAITLTAINGLYFAMINSTGLNLNNVKSFDKEKIMNKGLKGLLIGVVLSAGLVTAIPSALNGMKFINEILGEDKEICQLSAYVFAALALTVNGAFLTNANLPILNKGLNMMHKYRQRNNLSSQQESPEGALSWSASLGILLFSFFASVSSPAIFRATADQYSKNNILLNVGEYLSWGVICIQNFFYLSMLVKPKNEVDQEKLPLLDDSKKSYNTIAQDNDEQGKASTKHFGCSFFNCFDKVKNLVQKSVEPTSLS